MSARRDNTDIICGLWKFSTDFDNFQHGGQVLMLQWEIIYKLYKEVWQYPQTLKISLKCTHVKREELKHVFINYSFPYRSMVTKFIECPPDDVMGLCIKFGYDMSKGCWDIGVFPVWRVRGRISLAVADISARNNILAIRGGLIVSLDIENKF